MNKISRYFSSHLVISKCFYNIKKKLHFLIFKFFITLLLPPTSKGSATGTIPTTVLSYSDYISRPEEHSSLIRFDRGEREKLCRVVIIDDSLYEGEESFNVTLSVPVVGRLGKHYTTTKVNIVEDLDDGKAWWLAFIDLFSHLHYYTSYWTAFSWRVIHSFRKTY